MALSSCTTEVEEHCDLRDKLVSVEPVCAFDPSVLTTVQFPVQIWVDGQVAELHEYSFSYSVDSDFTGSAISVSYDQLPITVTITALDMDCSTTVTLDASYWD